MMLKTDGKSRRAACLAPDNPCLDWSRGPGSETYLGTQVGLRATERATRAASEEQTHEKKKLSLEKI